MPGTVCWFILDSSFIIYKFGKSPFVLLGYSRTQGTEKRIHFVREGYTYFWLRLAYFLDLLLFTSGSAHK